MNSDEEEKHGLRSRHVFLDTDAFYRVGFDLSHVTMDTLGRHVREERLVFHVTDITLREIQSHIRDDARSVFGEFNRANRKLAHWKRRFSHAKVEELKKIDDAEQAKRAYDTLRHQLAWRWKAEQHKASASSAVDIFDNYFERRAPFEKPSSKEFPDAFAISALSSWCKEHNEEMYVVTGDEAMQRSARACGVLHPIASLPRFLEMVTEAETPQIIQEVQSALATAHLVDGIIESLLHQVERLVVLYSGDRAEPEIYEHEVNSDPRLDDFSVLAASANEFTLLLSLNVPLTAKLTYEDRTHAIYDNEDDAYFGAETAETEIDDEVTVRATVTLDRKTLEIRELSMITSEVYIHENYDFEK